MRRPNRPTGAEPCSTFLAEGWVRLQGALPKSSVEPLAAHVRSELRRAKLAGPERSASHVAELPPFQQVTKLGQMLRLPAASARALEERLRPFVLALRAIAAPATQPAQLLVSLPLQGEWTVHGLPWHVDVTTADRRVTPGVQAFALLDDVAPRGGATLALARSHRLGELATTQGDVRELLKSNRDLDEELRARGLAIVEMAGRAGDVYLMDMRLLHSPSINATKRTRMMATVRFLAA